MPRFNEIINNFINGEVSPKMYGRSESEVYKRSCRTLKNMIVYPQGGAGRRMGTELILNKFRASDESFVSLSRSARIIDFVYSKTESYKVIFHGLGSTFGANYFLYIINVQDGHITAPFFFGGPGAGYEAYYDSIGGGATSENELTDADTIAEIQYAQNGSLMYFAHNDFPPFLLQRLGKNSFWVNDFYRPYNNFVSAPTADADAIWKAWPFLDINLTATTMSIDNAAVGSRTLTSSTDYFTSDMIGTPIAVTNSGTTGVAFISAVASATSATVQVVRAFPGTSAYTTWYASAWSKINGYPRCVSFAEGRVIWSSTKLQPETMWFSQSGDLFELSNPDVLDPGTANTEDDPGSLMVASEEANEILWTKTSGRSLLCGTRGREYSITDFNGTGLPPANVRAQTSSGSEEVQPVTVDDVPVYVQRGFRKLREMIYDYRVEGYTSPELSFLAEHMPRLSQEILPSTSPKIKAMAYQPLNNNLIWVIDTNGYLFSCTRSRENAVAAFHRHIIGGSYNGEFPFVQSISSGPSANGTEEELWIIVRRTVNGSEQITLERVYSEFNGTSLHEDIEARVNQPVFLDCAKLYRLKSSSFFATLSSSANADEGGGTLTGTATGTVSYADGVAHFTANSSYISWDGTSNADSAQTGAIRFKLSKFDLDSSGALITLFCISKADTDEDNLIKLQIDGQGANPTFGDVVLTIKDSGGVAIINAVTLGNIKDLFAGGTAHPIDMIVELNYDLTAGTTRLFINGKQLGATQTQTGTRDTSIDLIRINADEDGNGSRAGYAYSNIFISSSVLHTAEHDVIEQNPQSATIYGLEHLEGEEVKAVADGNYIGEFTVSGGEITVPESTYSTVIVGLTYQHLLEIQPVDAGTGIGSAMGSIKRIDRAVARFNKTAAASVGRDEDNLEELVFRKTTTPLGDPIELVTDDKVIDLNGDYDRQARVVVAGDVPLPCNVTCISLRGVTADV